MTKNIIVVGSINYDLITSVEKMPTEGETIIANKITYLCGGKGLNQATAASRISQNNPVKMIACYGDDIPSNDIKDFIKNENIATNGIYQVEGESGTAQVFIDEKGNNFVTIIPGANNKITDEQIESNIDNNEDNIIILQNEITTQINQKIIDEYQNQTIIYNPAPWLGENNAKWSNNVLVILNKIEFFQATNYYVTKKSCNSGHVEKLLEICKEHKLKNAIITLGEQGCILIKDDKAKFFQAYEANVIDSAAAGDCFIGTLSACLAEQQLIENAIDFASKAASILVERLGAAPVMPTRKEVEER